MVDLLLFTGDEWRNQAKKHRFRYLSLQFNSEIE